MVECMTSHESSDAAVPARDLRVSYAERDHVSALLNRHHLEGRLDGAELADRLAAVSTAVTRADLNSVVLDLPGAQDAVPTRDLLELTNTAGDLRRAGEWGPVQRTGVPARHAGPQRPAGWAL